MNLDKFDIADVTTALEGRSISAKELVDLQISQIKLRQDELNCYVTLDTKKARIAAALSDQRRNDNTSLSAIDGIPIAIKDNLNVSDLPTHNGSKFTHPVSGDADVIKVLRNSGAIIIGKLNMDECAIGGTTNNPHYGPTINPWKPGFVPGGSSGGASSAVAGGLAWAAIGTDTLGSVRLPAAYCGVVGLKATRGLISMNGIVPLSPSLDHVGPLCRSVRDARTFLNILSESNIQAHSEEKKTHLFRSRVGVLESALGPQSDIAVADAFERAVEDLRHFGANVTKVSLPGYELNELRHYAFLFIEAESSNILSSWVIDHPDAYSENLKSLLEYGRKISENQLLKIREKIAGAKTAIINLFKDIDFLATPTAPQTAFAFSDPVPINQAEITGLANISGVPAISLPCGISASGLPLSFQLMARPYGEHDLLDAAESLEGIWGRFSLQHS